MKTEFTIRCRAVIIHDGKLLTVRHAGKDFLTLPGGQLEFGESPIECVTREVVEERGIPPEIGKLLCVNSFIDGVSKQPVEFFFEITNAADYIKLEEMHRTHAHEIDEYVWVAPEDDRNIKPTAFADLFRQHGLNTGEVVFLQG